MTDEKKIVSLTEKRDKNKPVNQEGTGKQVSEVVHCSFCHRPNTQVVKMVQGPGVNICSECTLIAVQYLILEDRLPSGEAQRILDSFWNKVK